MNIRGLTPVGLFWEGGVPLVELRDLGDLTFTDPFFEQTVDRTSASAVRSNPVVLPVPEVCAWARDQDDLLSPAGFVFHMSRCGSTTISRTLAASPRNLVISEPEFTLDLLDAPAPIDDTLLDSWLERLVLLLGSGHSADKLVIKWHSLHTVHLQRLRRVFPSTPWIFVHRDPIEVMISALRNPSRFVRLKQSPDKAARMLRCTEAEIAGMSAEEYVARVLGLYCTIADAALASSGFTEAFQVDYRDLPDAIWDCVIPHFSLDSSPETRQTLECAARYYSKDLTSGRLYQDDSDAKRAQATPGMRHACEQWVAEPLGRLRHRNGCVSLRHRR